jgi:hypothetical protein
MNRHEKINYLEFPAADLAATRQFFAQVFSWRFEDFGPDYVAFQEGGISGGFFRSDLAAKTENGSVLVVFYSTALEETQRKIETAGGLIMKPIFSFPGGRRFHFSEPSGNEFAVWSDIGSRG